AEGGMSERARSIYDDEEGDVLFFEVPLDVELVAAPVQTPIYIARVVSDLVLSIFGEFDTVSSPLRTVRSLPYSEERTTGSQCERVEYAKGVGGYQHGERPYFALRTSSRRSSVVIP